MRLFSKQFLTLITTYLVVCANVHADPLAVPIPGQGTWESTLQPRDLDGDGTTDAWFDTSQGITWLEDANLALSDDLGGATGIDSSGGMNWNTAVAYVGKMVSHSYLGQTGWRLPRHTDVGGDGCNWTTASGSDCGFNSDPGTGELAHMFYVTLGNISVANPVTGYTPEAFSFFSFPGNTGPFANLSSATYWYGQEVIVSASSAWMFEFLGGLQSGDSTTESNRVWAVIDGDVGIPVVAPLLLESDSLPDGRLNVAYSHVLTASGGVPPYNCLRA